MALRIEDFSHRVQAQGEESLGLSLAVAGGKKTRFITSANRIEERTRLKGFGHHVGIMGGHYAPLG